MVFFLMESEVGEGEGNEGSVVGVRVGVEAAEEDAFTSRANKPMGDIGLKEDDDASDRILEVADI